MSSKAFKEKEKSSAFSVVEVIVVILLIIIIAGMIFCNVVFHSDNKSTSIFGYSFYKTRAVNMIPEIPVNTVIIAKKSEIPNIKENSVILCNIGEYTALIRVTEITQEDDETYYIVKFDTAPANETFRVSSEDVIAKAVWQLESFGKFLDFATSVPGIVIAVVIPLAIIIIIQVVRIRNIRELEREASSLDDFDDVIFSDKRNSTPAVTFTEPKFSEDVTDKAPPVRRELPKVGGYDSHEDELKSKAELTIDSSGKAAYRAAEKSPAEDNSGINSASKQLSAIGASARASSGSNPSYISRPTKIEPRVTEGFTPKTNSSLNSSDEERVVFTPHLSNVIPDSLVNIQEEAASSNGKSSFDESVKAYFEKNSDKPAPEAIPADEKSVSTIPENAAVPKETIAPVKKNRSSKTLEELMSIIDAEETKLKK